MACGHDDSTINIIISYYYYYYYNNVNCGLSCSHGGKTPFGYAPAHRPCKKAVFNLDFVEVISSPRIGVLRGIFLANHPGRTDN